MQSTRRKPQLRTCALAVLLLCLASACATYRNVHLRDAPTRIQQDDGVRVTTKEGEEYSFRVAAIDGEIISGPERAFRFSDLVMIERSEVDVIRSLYAYLAVGLVLIFI